MHIAFQAQGRPACGSQLNEGAQLTPHSGVYLHRAAHYLIGFALSVRIVTLRQFE